MSALEINFWLFVAVCAATWLTSIITKEYSWVDRIWSIIPGFGSLHRANLAEQVS